MSRYSRPVRTVRKTVLDKAVRLAMSPLARHRWRETEGSWGLAANLLECEEIFGGKMWLQLEQAGCCGSRIRKELASVANGTMVTVIVLIVCCRAV